jgi:hypothetical protein
MGFNLGFKGLTGYIEIHHLSKGLEIEQPSLNEMYKSARQHSSNVSAFYRVVPESVRIQKIEQIEGK